jgi:CBS domain-containing protein
MTQVREAMTASPTTVSPSTPVRDAARMMAEENVGSLPVVEDEQLVGVVTDRDLVTRVIAEDRDPSATTGGEVASRDVVTVGPDDELDRALQLMAKNQIRRIPVVEGGRLVGILAQADVAREAEPAQTGVVVEEISR